MKRYPHLVFVLVCLVTLSVPTGLSAFSDLREVIGDEGPAVDISGLWQEKYYLEITQNGTQVSARFATGAWISGENHSHCTEPGQVYFEGNLRGRTFIGELTVCNPQECVEEVGLEKSKKTKIQFDVSEDCSSLTGGWLWEEYKYKREDGKMIWCRPSGFTEWQEDFNAVRLLDCEAIQEQMKTMQQALSLYEEFRKNITDSNGKWEVRDGKVYLRGTDILVASDFNQLQEMLLDRVSTSDEGASFGGEPEAFDIEQAVRGHIPDEVKQAYKDKFGQEMLGDPCWCWENCGSCADWPDPLLYQICVSHELEHCNLLVSKCREARSLRPEAAVEVWNDYVKDIVLHLNDEIQHYQDNLETLRNELQAASHCN